MSLKINVAILFLLLSFTGFTQRNGVVRFSNNAGYRVLGWNPAEMMNYGGKVDVNIFSFSGIVFSSNSLFPNYGVTYEVSEPNLWEEMEMLQIENSELIVIGAFELPSFMFKLNENHAVGFSSSFRTTNYASVSDISVLSAVKGLYSAFDDNTSFNQQFLKGLSHTWLEFGASYAGKVYENSNSHLAVGATLKYLKGSSSGYFDASDISFTFYEGRDVPDITMNISYAYDQGLKDLVDEANLTVKSSPAVGFDFGACYTVHSENGVGHKYKFGVGIVDVGALKYNAQEGSRQAQIALTGIEAERFEQIKSVGELIDTLENSISIKDNGGNSYKMRLPTSFSIYADAQVYKRFYLGIEYNRKYNLFQLVNSSNKVLSNINIAPRYEGKRITTMIPLGYSNYLDYNVGFGLQTRYFTIGSSNLITELTADKDILALNLWLGFQWQIYGREPKTQDR